MKGLDPKTPEQFCWLYAAGCLEALHFLGKLQKNEYGKLLSCLNNRTFPTGKEIRATFQRPFTILEPHGERCTFEMMQNYWRVMHCNPSEETPVYRVVVETIGLPNTGSDFIQARYTEGHPGESKTVVVRNLHGLMIEQYDIVMVHSNIIAERSP